MPLQGSKRRSCIIEREYPTLVCSHGIIEFEANNFCNLAIEDVYEKYSLLRSRIDVNNPVLRNMVNRDNLFIFVKYMKKAPQTHWSVALPMMLCEESQKS